MSLNTLCHGMVKDKVVHWDESLGGREVFEWAIADDSPGHIFQEKESHGIPTESDIGEVEGRGSYRNAGANRSWRTRSARTKAMSGCLERNTLYDIVLRWSWNGL